MKLLKMRSGGYHVQHCFGLDGDFIYLYDHYIGPGQSWRSQYHIGATKALERVKRIIRHDIALQHLVEFLPGCWEANLMGGEL